MLRPPLVSGCNSFTVKHRPFGATADTHQSSLAEIKLMAQFDPVLKGQREFSEFCTGMHHAEHNISGTEIYYVNSDGEVEKMILNIYEDKSA